MLKHLLYCFVLTFWTFLGKYLVNLFFHGSFLASSKDFFGRKNKKIIKNRNSNFKAIYENGSKSAIRPTIFDCILLFQQCLTVYCYILYLFCLINVCIINYERAKYIVLMHFFFFFNVECLFFCRIIFHTKLTNQGCRNKLTGCLKYLWLSHF